MMRSRPLETRISWRRPVSESRRPMLPGVRRFTVELDADTVGRPIDALVDIRLPADQPFSGIDDHLVARPEVVDAIHLTGRFAYQLRLRCASIDDLDVILRDFMERLGVAETSTRVVLSSVAGFPHQPAPVG